MKLILIVKAINGMLKLKQSEINYTASHNQLVTNYLVLEMNCSGIASYDFLYPFIQLKDFILFLTKLLFSVIVLINF